MDGDGGMAWILFIAAHIRIPWNFLSLYLYKNRLAPPGKKTLSIIRFLEFLSRFTVTGWWLIIIIHLAINWLIDDPSWTHREVVVAPWPSFVGKVPNSFFCTNKAVKDDLFFGFPCVTAAASLHFTWLPPLVAILFFFLTAISWRRFGGVVIFIVGACREFFFLELTQLIMIYIVGIHCGILRISVRAHALF